MHGPTTISYNPDMELPAYWDGYNFRRTAGSWDGHEHMGFIHGEIIHRKMVNDAFAGTVLKVRKDCAKSAPVERPERILEMGCGSAQYTMGLAQAYPDSEIWACDLSARQLEEAQRRANEKGLTWQLFQAAGEKTFLAPEQFDLVTSYALFHELPTPVVKDVLAESLRLLKPGGYTFVADVKAYHVVDGYNRWKADFWNQLRGGDHFWREYATTDLAKLASSVGFREAKWYGVGSANYPFVLVAKK